MNGCNDNPTCEQFSAAFRKLLAYNTIMYSKFSNCQLSEDENGFNSNILSVSSKRSTTNKFETTDCLNVTEEQIECLYGKLHEIQDAEDHDDAQSLTEFTIAHIANIIEKRIKSIKQFSCPLCKFVFEENVKLDENFMVKSTE